MLKAIILPNSCSIFVATCTCNVNFVLAGFSYCVILNVMLLYITAYYRFDCVVKNVNFASMAIGLSDFSLSFSN